MFLSAFLFVNVATPAKYIKLEDLLNKYYVFPPFVLINSLYLHNQYMLYRTIGIITNH